MTWHDEAACKNRPTRYWFPVVVDGLRVNAGDPYAYGRAICAGCPVSAECLAYALEARERSGLWGGLDPAERTKRLRGTKVATVRKDPAHGTAAGYQQHRRRGEQACESCMDAKRRDVARRKAERREMAS